MREYQTVEQLIAAMAGTYPGKFRDLRDVSNSLITANVVRNATERLLKHPDGDVLKETIIEDSFHIWAHNFRRKYHLLEVGRLAIMKAELTPINEADKMGWNPKFQHKLRGWDQDENRVVDLVLTEWSNGSQKLKMFSVRDRATAVSYSCGAVDLDQHRQQRFAQILRLTQTPDLAIIVS